MFGVMLLVPLVCAAPQPVDVGAYIQDIHNLDLKTHSYAADLYLWFRWPTGGPDPAAAMEFMNAYELWGHTRTTEYDAPVELSPGVNHQVVRVQGRFSSKFSLADYPLDHQVLRFEFEDAHLSSDALEFHAVEVSRNPDLRLPGYLVGAPRITVTQKSHPSTFGDTRMNTPGRYSHVRVEVDVWRPTAPYALKLLLPVLCVLLATLLMFLFKSRHVDARVGMGITALLTVVALQITLNNDLPDVEYLILMDKVYLFSYVFVLVSVALVVWTTRLDERGHQERAETWNRRSLWGLLTVGTLCFSALLSSHAG